MWDIIEERHSLPSTEQMKWCVWMCTNRPYASAFVQTSNSIYVTFLARDSVVVGNISAGNGNVLCTQCLVREGPAAPISIFSQTLPPCGISTFRNGMVPLADLQGEGCVAGRGLDAAKCDVVSLGQAVVVPWLTSEPGDTV